MRIQFETVHPPSGFIMMFRKVLLALGALFAGNAFAQSSFSIYFNGESSTTNCYVDGVSNAQLSTTGSGNLVASATTPLHFVNCGISGNAQPLTFGPAQDLLPSTQTLAAGSNVAGNFSVRPLNAASCTAAITRTSGSGTVSPASVPVCSSQSACANLSSFSANFTNTSTSSASTWSAQVSCTAVSGASPSTLSSQLVTITQNAAGALSNATINGSANGSTNATVGTAVSFTGAVTNPNNDPVTYSWNFGDGSANGSGQNVSHTYATTTGSPFTVTLTVTDTSTNQTITATNTVTVAAASSCTTIASSTPGIANFTQLTGNQNVYYFGSGTGTGPQSVDVTSFASFWWAAWPGQNGRTGYVAVPTNKYMSQQFAVPVGYFAGVGSTTYGRYAVGTSSNSTSISMSISTKCGDFSNPATYPATSSVVPGCWINAAQPGGFVQWVKTATSGACTLTEGKTYYLNFINADVGQVTPTGGTAASSKNSNCGPSTCNMSLISSGNF
jgi:hypothetical protein